ncbi:tetratricopeptide repeat protein [Pararhodonellum marinum]|uniref:tetratricopeptide repeat protein n=1 Tax=Pararhodonellum marinum TaxID=2755358 RepID=UPI00188F26E8|nr:hypothetical protein [Pararhodonellum marinum]
MASFKTFLFILLLLPASWTQIGNRNKAISQAAEYYNKTDYEASVRQHLALITEHQVTGPRVNYNLALSYHYNGQQEEASKQYTSLVASANPVIPSFASNQLGTIQGYGNKYKEALASFKQALIKNPNNEEARYNYELLARWLEENPDQKEESQDKDQSEKQEPSDYAKRMKAQADEMVDQFRFEEAFDLMNRALEIDETVSAYQEFINNLGDVYEINRN